MRKQHKQFKSAVSAGRKGRRKRVETFSIYIYKVLKQVHPDISISKKAMGIMNSLICDTFDRIASEGSKLARFNKKATLSHRDIQSAVKLLLHHGQIARHAICEASRVAYWFFHCNRKYRQQK